jgi:hypothetical protein
MFRNLARLLVLVPVGMAGALSGCRTGSPPSHVQTMPPPDASTVSPPAGSVPQPGSTATAGLPQPPR